jgi:hypothetical protein
MRELGLTQNSIQTACNHLKLTNWSNFLPPQLVFSAGLSCASKRFVHSFMTCTSICAYIFHDYPQSCGQLLYAVRCESRPNSDMRMFVGQQPSPSYPAAARSSALATRCFSRSSADNSCGGLTVGSSASGFSASSSDCFATPAPVAGPGWP